MGSKVRIALSQIDCTVGDLEGNSKKIAATLDQARDEGVDIVSFPEMTLTGYPPEDLLLKGSFIEDNLKALDRISEKCLDITAVVGFAASADSDGGGGGLYNAAAVIHNGTIAGVYYKNLLPNYGVFDEKRYFLAGEDSPVFMLGDLIFGVNICEDIWHPHGPMCRQAKQGKAELIMNINASPFHAGKYLERRLILEKRIKENGVAIAYTNMVGGQDELVFDGGSMILNNSGELVASAPQFEEALLIADLEFEGSGASEITEDEKEHCPIIRLEGSIRNKSKAICATVEKELEGQVEIYKALVMGTRDYVLKNGFKEVIIGLSGGIDSALTAAIAVDALGSDKVMGVAMPSPYSSQGSIDDAKALAENLKIDFHIVPIEKVFSVFKDTLKPLFEGYEEDVTEENIQARIRGNLLMAISNKFGRMVLTTGNKSEVGVGYSTLYGDMAGGFNILKDVPKTLVYELSRYVNKEAGSALIPENTLTKAPSAELRPDQKDQDSLPPYDLLDDILQKYVEYEWSFDEIVNKGHDPAIVKRIIGLVEGNEYKRRQAAPGVKITPRAFGRDRRVPIVNLYRQFQKDND